MYPVLADEEIYEPEVYDEYTQGLEELGFRFKPFKAVKRAFRPVGREFNPTIRRRRKKRGNLKKVFANRNRKYTKKERLLLNVLRRKTQPNLKWKTPRISPLPQPKYVNLSCNLTKYSQILAQMKKIYDNNQRIIRRNQQILNENRKIYQQNQKVVNEFKTILRQFGLM